MALAEDLSRLAGFDQPNNNAEINVKIKPLTAQSVQEPGPAGAPSATMTSAGEGAAGGGSGPAGGGGTAAAAQPLPTGGWGPEGQSIVPQNQRRTMQNPTLVTHPTGAYTDDIYEAAVAGLVNQTQQQYARLMQELGWMSDTGEFMPGTLETQAVRDRFMMENERQLALDRIRDAARRGGTTFSGRRAKLEAQSNTPYDVGLSNLETQLSRALAERWQGLAGLTQGFEIDRNSLIAQAAERAAAAARASAGGGDGGPVTAAPAAGDGTAATGPVAPDWIVARGQEMGWVGRSAPPRVPEGADPAGWVWVPGVGAWRSVDGQSWMLPQYRWSPQTALAQATGGRAMSGPQAI